MFREDNNVYYRPDCTDTNHADKIVRQPKKKELLADKKCQLNIAKTYVKSTQYNDTLHKKYAMQIRKLEREIAELESIDNMQHKNIHKPKKMNPDKILDYCKQKIEESKLNNIGFITAEDIAYQLNTHVYLVKQCFNKLNKMGMLSQANHHHLHDCWREDGDSGWTADVYYIRI